MNFWGFSIVKNRCGLLVQGKIWALHDHELSLHSTALIQSLESQVEYLAEIKVLVRKKIYKSAYNGHHKSSLLNCIYASTTNDLCTGN